MSWIDDLLREYPSFETARGKLDAIDSHYSNMEKKILQLQEENEKLHRDLTALQTVQPGFVDASGVSGKANWAAGSSRSPIVLLANHRCRT